MDTGRVLLRLAARLCSEETREQIVEPLLADMQREVAMSPAGIQRMAARFRGAMAFWQTMLICGGRATVRDLAAAAQRLTWPSTATVVVVAVSSAVALAVGQRIWQVTAVLRSPSGALMLLPAIAMWPAMLWVRRRSIDPRRQTRQLLLIAGALAILLAVGWLAPWAQQRPGLSGVAPATRALGLQTLIGIATDAHARDRVSAIQELSLRGAIVAFGVFLGASAWIVMGLGEDQRWQIGDLTFWIAYSLGYQARFTLDPPGWIGPLSLILNAVLIFALATKRPAWLAWRNQPPQTLGLR